jgi:hypothetical protein
MLLASKIYFIRHSHTSSAILTTIIIVSQRLECMAYRGRSDELGQGGLRRRCAATASNRLEAVILLSILASMALVADTPEEVWLSTLTCIHIVDCLTAWRSLPSSSVVPIFLERTLSGYVSESATLKTWLFVFGSGRLFALIGSMTSSTTVVTPNVFAPTSLSSWSEASFPSHCKYILQLRHHACRVV